MWKPMPRRGLLPAQWRRPPMQLFVRAGVEIKLDPGWKTYWRDPGDSGMPPTLDFSGSDNVKAVTVLWPAPQAIPRRRRR